jgi:hypothetical protein
MHRLCPHCGKTFAPGRYATRRRYCSPACCWAATYAARKAANPATRRPGRPPNPRTVAAPATPPERLAAVLDAVRNR